MATFPPKEEISDAHAWAETRDRCPHDSLLRRHGFQIERRPKDGEAVWSRKEKAGEHEYVTVSYTETEAMTAALKETQSVARGKR